MTALLDVSMFKARTLMTSGDVDELESVEPGWLAARLTINTSKIHARLAKRYETPFALPSGSPRIAQAPEIVLGWLVDLTTEEAYEKRGYNPSSEQDARIAARAAEARAELKEAADSESGLFDLPLRQDATGTSGVTLGGPFGYSEASPYAWTDAQRDAVRDQGGR